MWDRPGGHQVPGVPALPRHTLLAVTGLPPQIVTNTPRGRPISTGDPCLPTSKPRRTALLLDHKPL